MHRRRRAHVALGGVGRGGVGLGGVPRRDAQLERGPARRARKGEGLGEIGVARERHVVALVVRVLERERVRRELACNPMLWPGAEIPARLEHALLVGGVHVHGAAAYRFAIPGDGDCEAWFFLDGTPAGFAFRDPVRRARVEWYVRGTKLRVVVDGELERGWSGGMRATGKAENHWFRRDA